MANDCIPRPDAGLRSWQNKFGTYVTGHLQNRLANPYMPVNREVLWRTISEHLPTLFRVLEGAAQPVGGSPARRRHAGQVQRAREVDKLNTWGTVRWR